MLFEKIVRDCVYVHALPPESLSFKISFPKKHFNTLNKKRKASGSRGKEGPGAGGGEGLSA